MIGDAMEHLKQGLESKFQRELELKKKADELKACNDLLLRSEGAVSVRGRGLQELHKHCSAQLVELTHGGFGSTSEQAERLNGAIGAAMARHRRLEQLTNDAKDT